MFDQYVPQAEKNYFNSSEWDNQYYTIQHSGTDDVWNGKEWHWSGWAEEYKHLHVVEAAIPLAMVKLSEWLGSEYGGDDGQIRIVHHKIKFDLDFDYNETEIVRFYEVRMTEAA